LTRLNTNELFIEYEDRGNFRNTPLVLIRGLGTQLSDWSESFINTLADSGFRVIIFDNRDAGLSYHSKIHGFIREANP